MEVILLEGTKCPGVVGEGLRQNYCSIHSDISAVSTFPCCPEPQPLDPVAHLAGQGAVATTEWDSRTLEGC